MNFFPVGKMFGMPASNQSNHIFLHPMRKKIWIMAIAILPACSSGQWKQLGKEVNKAVKSGGPLTTQEVTDGLKQALSIGSQNAGTTASKVDGYFKNPVIKIPFPPNVKKVETQLRSL